MQHRSQNTINLGMPEDLYDNAYEFDGQSVVNMTVTPEVGSLLASENSKETRNKKSLKQEMGIVGIHEMENGSFILIINPHVYAAWYEKQKPKKVAPTEETKPTVKKQKLMRSQVKSTLFCPEEAIFTDEKEGNLKDMLLEEEEEEIRHVAKEAPDEEGENEKKETKPSFTALFQERPKRNRKAMQPTKRKQRDISKDEEDDDDLSLVVSPRQLKSLFVSYYNLESGNNFKTHLDTLQRLTGTKIRKIKKTEIKLLDSNYMVNRDNITEGLDELVNADGRISTPDVDKFYDVLTIGKDIVGHLVFEHDKTKNEIIIPAVEIDLNYRGRHYASLFFLRVFQYAQENGIKNIKLKTGHHKNNTKELKDIFDASMRTFYCKLGFRIDREKPEDWSQKNLPEKVACFKADNEECVFDSSKHATELALEEANKTAFAYQIKRELTGIVDTHRKRFSTTDTKYTAYDLLAYEPYKKWLTKKLSNNSEGLTIPEGHIEASLKILYYEYKSKKDITKDIKQSSEEKVDYSALNEAINYQPSDSIEKSAPAFNSGRKGNCN